MPKFTLIYLNHTLSSKSMNLAPSPSLNLYNSWKPVEFSWFDFISSADDLSWKLNPQLALNFQKVLPINILTQ